MTSKLIAVLTTATVGAGYGTAVAQVVQSTGAIASSDTLSQISMYSYREGPKSDLFLRGTPLAATAQGEAEVEYQDGNARISASAENLPRPATLGPYTTYVLWALTPDGRATNQGVLDGPDGGKGEMQTQYGASQFALIVTAEPHFAVTMPSTMMVLYNVADDVKGEETKVTTLTEQADYTQLAGSRLSRVEIDDENPLEVVQARYAVAIARAAGATEFASDAYASANEKLAAAEVALRGKRKSERKTAPGLAREAIVAGEDARRSAMLASTAASVEAERVASANAATTVANKASAAAATVAARNAATAKADAAASATAVERQRSSTAARDELRERLNAALPTRNSDRGLISEVGGVQFATGTADTDSSAREGLARFSGIVSSYPGLRFNVEGHTDNVGGAALNKELSLRRAITVRDYLIAQGLPASSIDVAGHGFEAPIGDNSTADGRTRNRRVEIVVSGGPLDAS
jgi:outer membrane protein OmpA-like peptidoglycan-associated protein